MYDYRKELYCTSSPYIINHNIQEYDITKADISILFTKGVITEEQYLILKNSSKEVRNISIGYLLKDKKLSELYYNALAEYRKRFIKENNIRDENIVSVRKDSFFIMDQPVNVLVFDNLVEFTPKKHYTIFINVCRLQILYNYDMFRNVETVDVKGIADEKLPLHGECMMLFLCELFEYLSSGTMQDTIEFLQNFLKKYTARELPVGYYREFNPDSQYRIIITQFTNYQLQNATEEQKQYLDISYNANFIRELFGIVSSIYFGNFKR